MAPRWLFYSAPPIVAACAAGAGLLLSRRVLRPQEPERYVFLEQHDASLRAAFGQQARCLRKRCGPFLADCKRRRPCLEVLDGLLGNRCQDLDAVCAGLGYPACPPGVGNLWGCWKEFCRISSDSFGSSGAHKFRAGVPASELPRVYDVREAVAADDAAAGLDPTHRRNFGESASGLEGSSAYDSHGHSTAYLHTRMHELYPELLARLGQLAREADRARGWGIWRRLEAAGAPVPGVRCVELITYVAGGEGAAAGGEEGAAGSDESIGWHFDTGSLLTAAVMLSAEGDYDGGSFEIRPSREDCWPELTHTLGPGDVLVWESWRPHRVTPVTRGNRSVLVVELWEFANTTGQSARRPDVPSDYRRAGVQLWGARWEWAWEQLFAAPARK